MTETGKTAFTRKEPGAGPGSPGTNLGLKPKPKTAQQEPEAGEPLLPVTFHRDDTRDDVTAHQGKTPAEHDVIHLSIIKQRRSGVLVVLVVLVTRGCEQQQRESRLQLEEDPPFSHSRLVSELRCGR